MRVVLSPEARNEFLDEQYYEQQWRGLGERFRAEVRVALQRVRRWPLSCPVEHGEIRRLTLTRFPKRGQGIALGNGRTIVTSNGCRHLMDYRQIITVEPGKRGRKPCIRGLRITVYEVLSDLASGMSEDEILKDFPYLTRDDIRACLAYAADREQAKLIATS
jgi:uncharacterized protein (DUF433 family)